MALDDIFPFVTLSEFERLARVLRNESTDRALGIYVELKTPTIYREAFNIVVEDVIFDALSQDGAYWLQKEPRLVCIS